MHGGTSFGDRAILSMQNCPSSSITIPLLKLLPLITFLFPVLNHLYLGILEEYSLGILSTKLGKNHLWETKVMGKSSIAIPGFCPC